MNKPVFIHRLFVDSLDRLSSSERASVQRMLSMLAEGDVTPGMRPHPVGPFLSLSPNMDLRVIAATNDTRIALLFVAHHDTAYRWAETRAILATDCPAVELVSVQALLSDSSATAVSPVPIPMQDLLLIKDPDLFLDAISDMSPEWQEWAFSAYITPGTVPPPPTTSSLVVLITEDTPLQAALRLDLPAWQVFLHPTQRKAATDVSSRSIAITGSPGTGKTVVLLNRLLLCAPKGRDADCSVLLAYSESLADYLEQHLRETSTRHYYVFPMYYLGGRIPERARRAAALKKIKLLLRDGTATVQYRDGTHRVVREILVDETQDAPNEVLGAINILMDHGATRVVLAADLDQTIHRLNQPDVARTLSRCMTTYDMTYCYRSTRQIMDVARRWLSSAGAPPHSTSAFALSGPRVRFVECSSLSEQVDESARILVDLERRYARTSLALIYCQYYNPSFNRVSDEESLIKSDPRVRNHYRFASLTKGKEYFAGVVFVSHTFMARQLPDDAKRLRLDTLYVALTRFRDEVTVAFPRGCSIEALLNDLIE